MSEELEQGFEPTEGADESELTEGQAQEQEQQAPTFEQLYEKHGLKDRWKAESDVEKLDKTLKSYTELETHVKQRLETENFQLRQALINAANQSNMQRQQPAPQPVQREPLTPEAEAAEKFVQERIDRYYKETVMPELQRRDVAIEQLEFNNYMNSQMANPVFKEVYDSQELGQRVQWMANQGARVNAQLVDKAFKDIIAEKYPTQMAQVQQKAFTQGQDFNKQKEQAFVQGGGKSQRQMPSDLTTTLKQLEGDNITYEQALAIAQKKGWVPASNS